MKIFTIIKANSERLPKKNFLDLAGKQLWRHLIDELSEFDCTINTDSEEIFRHVNGISRPNLHCIKRKQKHIDWENDPNIDTSPVLDMLFDFCRDLGDEIVVLTHVTSPFLTASTIIDAASILDGSPEHRSIHSVMYIQDFCWLNKTGNAVPINFNPNVVQCTQDLEKVMCSKGAFFIARASDIIKDQDRLPAPTLYYGLSHVEAIEIDTREDFKFAKLITKCLR